MFRRQLGERYYQGTLHQYVREALWKHMHCATDLCKLAEMVTCDEGKMICVILYKLK